VTIQQCFQTAARIQLLLRDLHSGLARCFGKDPVLRETFTVLAREEEERAVRIRCLVLHRKGDPWSDEAIDTISRDLVATLAELSAMATEISRKSGQLHVEPVLRRVIEMERRCARIHAASLARSPDPEVWEFFASLAKPDLRLERLLTLALRTQTTSPRRPTTAPAPLAALRSLAA
jgi:hypothetical protein